MSENAKKQMIVIAVEGGLSAGKSLLLTTLRLSPLVAKYAMFVVEEPVAEWQNVDGENLMQLYYSDPMRYAFDFQLHCVYTRLHAVRKILAQAAADTRPVLLILERSWHSDVECFAALHYRQGHLNHLELNLLRRIVGRDTAFLPPLDGVIMVDTCLELAMQRLKVRDRTGESSIQPEYLSQLMHEYNSWLDRAPIPYIRIDGAALFQQQPVQYARVDAIIQQIGAFVLLLSDPQPCKRRRHHTKSPVIFPVAVPFTIPFFSGNQRGGNGGCRPVITGSGEIRPVTTPLVAQPQPAAHPLVNTGAFAHPLPAHVPLLPDTACPNFANFYLDEEWDTYHRAGQEVLPLPNINTDTTSTTSILTPPLIHTGSRHSSNLSPSTSAMTPAEMCKEMTTAPDPDPDVNTGLPPLSLLTSGIPTAPIIGDETGIVKEVGAVDKTEAAVSTRIAAPGCDPQTIQAEETKETQTTEAATTTTTTTTTTPVDPSHTLQTDGPFGYGTFIEDTIVFNEASLDLVPAVMLKPRALRLCFCQ